MARLLQLALLFAFSTGALAAAVPHLAERAHSACASNTTQVVPWAYLSRTQKQRYLEASLCLTKEPAKLGIGGAKTRWDELQYLHAVQRSWIHFVGAFLPWHRYFVSVHRSIMRDECGYNGPLAYWDEVADSELSTLADSELFQADAFGGNGTGAHRCIDNGIFANVTLTFPPGSAFNALPNTENNTCIFRNLTTASLAGSSSDTVATCMAETTFDTAWPCIEQGPHGAGHAAVSGLMANVAYSPGDPVFFLHHAFIDLLWWHWQTGNLSERLTEIGGTNAPTQDMCDALNETCPGPDILNYDGDPSNVTTLNHVLWMMDIYPNVTVGDVMNINSSDVCLDYVWIYN